MSDFQAYNQALASNSAQMEAGDQLAHAMKLIIIPMLTRSFELNQHKVLDDACVRSMVKDMFDPAEEIQGMLGICLTCYRQCFQINPLLLSAEFQCSLLKGIILYGA